jgi:hypothetical protein
MTILLILQYLKKVLPRDKCFFMEIVTVQVLCFAEADGDFVVTLTIRFLHLLWLKRHSPLVCAIVLVSIGQLLEVWRVSWLLGLYSLSLPHHRIVLFKCISIIVLFILIVSSKIAYIFSYIFQVVWRVVDIDGIYLRSTTCELPLKIDGWSTGTLKRASR